MVIRLHGETWKQCDEQLEGEEYIWKFLPVLQHGHPHNTQNVAHQVKDYWRSQR